MDDNVLLCVGLVPDFAASAGAPFPSQPQTVDNLAPIRLILHFIKRLYELGAFVSEVKGNSLAWRISFHPEGDPRQFPPGKSRSLSTAELCQCFSGNKAISLHLFDHKYQLQTEADVEGALDQQRHRFARLPGVG